MKKLEAAAYVAIIVLCLTAAGLLLERRFSPSGGAPGSGGPKVGAYLSDPQYKWNSARKTIVAAVAPGCQFCTASMPLYQRLSRLGATAGASGAVPFVFVSPLPPEAVEAYASEHSVSAVKVVKADFRKMGVAGTPTLLVVDSQGRIGKVFVGLLSQANETELFDYLRQ